jgi:transcriptional regulator with XRE-family HTH domain
MAERHVADRADTVLDSGRTAADLDEHRVAVLSAAVLRMARQGYRESQTHFAERAGVTANVVEGAEDGTRPAWALPYCQFAALAGAASALNPWLRTLFETAAACDLLLSCVLNGEQAFATVVLMQPGTRELAKSLLRLAITGEPGAAGPTGLPAGGRLLMAGQVSSLRERTVALAASGSPDAWAAALILAAGWGERP